MVKRCASELDPQPLAVDARPCRNLARDIHFPAAAQTQCRNRYGLASRAGRGDAHAKPLEASLEQRHRTTSQPRTAFACWLGEEDGN